MTLVCGDSHTSTHGALASLAFGIGTSDVEHVLATQCINLTKEKNFRINIDGQLNKYISSKDLILHIIGVIGTSGGTGYTIEFAGECIRAMSIESRMTMCNMSIEAGAKSGLIAFDDKTFDYIQGKAYAPSKKYFDKAVKYWESLSSDADAIFDKEITIHANEILPQVTWGTSPEMTTNINGLLPDPEQESDLNKKEYIKRALEYMDLSLIHI